MSIYISYHPLDCDFAYQLLAYMRNLGLDTNCVPLTLIACENLSRYLFEHDKLIAILRPEYLQSSHYQIIARLIDNISVFVPILRVEIPIEEWSANVAFYPILDFSSRDKQVLDLNLNSLRDIISTPDTEQHPPNLREIYLNNLEVTLRTYFHPFYLLESVNYESNQDDQIPVINLLNKTRFKINQLNKQFRSRKALYLSRTDFLNNIVKYHDSFVIACHDIDAFAVACYLVNLARHRARFDSNAPIPIFLDFEYWDSNISWEDWLQSQVTFTNTPISDIATGKCAVYVYGLDYPFFKQHPQKHTFEEWLYGVFSPRHFIIICTHNKDIEDYLASNILVTPIESDLISLQQTCLEYLDRPFAQFLSKIVENRNYIPSFNYLLKNSVFAALLLSVTYDTDTNFEQLGIRDYFEKLIENLWQIANRISHEDQTDLKEIAKQLLKLAALTIEQQRTKMNYDEVFSLIASDSLIIKCATAGFFSIKEKDIIQFSFPIIQEHFAANALAEFGISIHLPNLTLDNQFRRIPQRWDKSVIICCHISQHKNDTLKLVARIDPILALLCIVAGVKASPSVYSFIIEQNLNFMTTLGDFRIDFASTLYDIHPDTAKSIFMEILRDANWSIRLRAYDVFFEREKSFLPGLAEAVAELIDNTKPQVVKALHRLGINALPTLFKLLRTDNAKQRVNTAWALGELQDKASVPALVEVLQDNDIRVSKQAIISLALLQDINCVPYLVQYISSRHAGMRKVAINALVHFQGKMPEQFASIVRSIDASTKRLVIQVLHNTSFDSFVDLLLELSKDENVDVRIAAIIELGLHPEIHVISRLKDCLNDMSKSTLSKSTVSEVVSKVLSNIQKANTKPQSTMKADGDYKIMNVKTSKSSDIVKARLLHIKETRVNGENSNFENPDETPIALSEIPVPKIPHDSTVGDDSYVSAILEQLRERTWNNSNNAANTLREYVKGLHGKASLNVINQILETLNDPDWVIRWTGVETLGWIGNVYVVPHLIQRLADNNWKIRIAAIRALSEIGDKTAVTGLSNLLYDTNSVVREASAEALGYLDSHEALQALESAAVDQEDFVRLAVIESLGRMRQKAAMQTLLSALKDKNSHVRWAAANGLYEISSLEMVSSLLSSLSDTAGPYWEQKRICDIVVDILKQIGTKEALNAVAAWRNGQG